MKFNLKNKVLPSGFNKRAVYITSGIIGLIIFSFIGYVLMSNSLGSGKKGDSEAKQKIEINDDMTNHSTIDNIVNTKPIIPLPNILNKTNNLNGILGNKTNESIITNIPPIVPTQKIETEYDKQAHQIENQAKIKKLQSQYAALDAKSSMIGNGSNNNGGSKDNTANNTNIAAMQKSALGNSESSSNNISQGGGTSPYLDSELIKPKSPYLLQAGSIIPCVMISGINSDLSGQVIAQVRENVYDSISSRFLLIPQGSKLIGSFSNQVAYGQKRLGVAWSRVIYPNGYSIDLKGIPGSDVAGFSGFYDQVDNHYWSIFGSSFVIGMITAGMQYSQNNTNPNVQVGGLGITTNPTMGQTISGSLGQQLGQTGAMVAQKGLNVAPTLTIRQGYMFTIMLTADVALKPYR